MARRPEEPQLDAKPRRLRPGDARVHALQRQAQDLAIEMLRLLHIVHLQDEFCDTFDGDHGLLRMVIKRATRR